MLRAERAAAFARTLLAAFGVVTGALATACGSGPGPGENVTSIAPGVIARVGAQEIDAEFVGRLATARQIAPRAALELALSDALLAEHATRSEPHAARWLQRTALARSLLRELGRQAEGAGLPSSDELAALVASRWWALDRPRMVGVTHAVVLSAQDDPAAEALAHGIRMAVADSVDPETFGRAARAVPPGDLRVQVEVLPPVALDGRSIDPDQPPPGGPPEQHLVPAFARAAQALERPGQISPVVRTGFGYHVLRASRVIPPLAPRGDVLLGLVQRDVIERRASRLLESLLSERRGQTPPSVEPSAVASMQSLDRPR